MKPRRRDVLQAFVWATLSWAFDTRAEPPPGRVHHVGFLGATSLSEHADRLAALQDGLRQLGYIEGTNIVIHYKWAEGRYERLPDLAAELVRLNVDLILTHAAPLTRAAMAATATIPIVVIVAGDLLSHGLVPSLARPSGNVTGQTIFFAEVCAKRVELIKEVVPGATRVAVLGDTANPVSSTALAAMQRAAHALGLELLTVGTGGIELVEAFATMTREGAQALVVIEDPLLISKAEYIAELALKSRIPVIGEERHAKAGGVMAYGADLNDLWFRSATLVDRVLNGTKPADLPIQQATKFELIVNVKSAEALGLTVPPSLLARADAVIE